MRISDWSSDVCSSDLSMGARMVGDLTETAGRGREAVWQGTGGGRRADRKSVVSGKSVSVRVDLGGRRIIKKTTLKYGPTPIRSQQLSATTSRRVSHNSSRCDQYVSRPQTRNIN